MDEIGETRLCDIVVGNQYFGQTITGVHSTVTETEFKRRTIKLINLVNGTIMKLNHIHTKSEKEQFLHWVSGPVITIEGELHAHCDGGGRGGNGMNGNGSSKKKKAPPVVVADDDDDTFDLHPTNFANLKMDSDKNSTRKGHGFPMEITVYARNAPDCPQARRGDPRGVWNVEDTDETAKWGPTDVLLYKPGDDLPVDLDPNCPVGVWCYSQGTEPEDEDQDWMPFDAVLYPPGADVPEDVPKRMYSFHPNSASPGWPPRILPDRVNIPRCFRDEEWDDPVPAVIYPRNHHPGSFNPDVEDAVGVWEHLDDEDDDDWMPFEVVVVKGDSPGIDLDIPHGVFAMPHDAAPQENGKWSPEDFVFFQPGEEPDKDAYKKMGMWKPPPGKLDYKWPPTKEVVKVVRNIGKLQIPSCFQGNWNPIAAMAYPRSSKKKPELFSVDEGASVSISGIWENLDDDETLVPDIPIDLIVTRNKVDESLGTPTGVFAISNEATPSVDGDWDPYDFMFYPPGQKPEEGSCEPLGSWKRAPGDLDKPWPPTNDGGRSSRSVGKLPSWRLADDWAGQRATVYSASTAPHRNEANKTNGVWKFDDPSSEPTDAELWQPQEVVLYKEGQEPDDDMARTCGIWGTNPDAQPDATTGQWLPSDFWIFAPGEAADSESGFQPRGKWGYPVDSSRKLGSANGWPPMVRGSPIGTKKIAKLPSNRSLPSMPSTVGIPRCFQGENIDPVPAIVYPRSARPGPFDPDEDDDAVGVWVHTDDEDDSDWEPMEVVIVKGNSRDIDSAIPHGIFAMPHDAAPNKDGKWNPEDFAFFQPGENPNEDAFKKVGLWKPPPGKLDYEWPPVRSEAVKGGRPNKLPNWRLAKDWSAQKATVYSRSVAPADNEDYVVNGVWQYGDPEDEPEDAGDWKAQDVIMYKDGKEPTDPSSLQGDWGTNQNAEPDSKTGHWKPKDLFFYAPGETAKLGNGFRPKGKWGYDPASRKMGKVGGWPPQKNGDSKDAGSIRQLPNWFKAKNDWVGQRATVHNSKGVLPANKMLVTNGVWKFADPSSEPDDFGLWKPQEVIMYREGQEPTDKSQTSGVWGTNSNSKPDKSGHWQPRDLHFAPPGETLSDSGFTPRGKWGYDPASRKMGKVGGWPPAKRDSSKAPRVVGQLPNWRTSKNWYAQKATVYAPRTLPASASKNEDFVTNGVWKFRTADNEPEGADLWKPQEVIMYRSGEEPDPGNKDAKVRGDWGTNPGAEVDPETDHWQPKDLWFLPPGETPSERGFTPRGKWGYDPKTIGKVGGWPPQKREPAREPRKVGKLNWLLAGNDWFAQRAKVYTPHLAPEKNQDNETHGIWKYRLPSNEPVDSKMWKPQEVVMYREGQEPDDEAEPDLVKPCGVWGTAPDATPDEDTGTFKPKDLWFFAPGDTAEPKIGFKPRGKWGFDRKKIGKVGGWPPPKAIPDTGSPTPGKLKIPNMFSKGDSGTPRGTPGRKVGKLAIPKFS